MKLINANFPAQHLNNLNTIQSKSEKFFMKTW